MPNEEKVLALALTPASEITADNMRMDSETDTYQFSDAAALKLVLDDANAADTFINLNQWASGWTMADTLYQSPAASSAFDGGNVAQANVPKFMVSNHISSIVPKLMSGIFYEDPPFLLRPHPGTKQEVIRAKSALFSAQLYEMQFEEESERALDQMALLGTCVMKWGYLQFDEKIRSFARVAAKMTVEGAPGTQPTVLDTPESDDFEIVYTSRQVSRPWIRYCDLRSILVDPGCRYGDIRRANWVVYRDYATYSDLEHLRGVDGYDIPSEEVLKSIFLSNPTSGPDNISMTIPEGMRGYLQHSTPRSYKTTADPTKTPIQVLERWDKEKVIVILSFNNINILIRNEPNPYGKIPFLSANWRNIPDSFYGQGLGQLIGAEQLVEQGITNLALDLLAYGLQPMAVQKRGMNVLTQNTRWRQGGIIVVDEDVEKAFKFLQMPNVPGEAWQFIQQAQSSSAATSGANEQVVQGAGAMGVRSTGMRSGTGAAAVIQANASRLDGPDGRFVRQVFEPWLYQMDELNNEFLPTSVLKRVLGEELGTAYQVDHIDFRNAKIEYEVLAGAKLGAKKEMAQFLPLLLNMFNNPTFAQNISDAGYRFDGLAIFKAFADSAGWKFSQDFLVPMDPVQKQKHDANSPAALQQKQAQTAQQLQAQKLEAEKQADLLKFQHEETIEDQKQLGKAAGEVTRQAFEHAATSETVNGTPGDSGFGSTTAI